MCNLHCVQVPFRPHKADREAIVIEKRGSPSPSSQQISRCGAGLMFALLRKAVVPAVAPKYRCWDSSRLLGAAWRAVAAPWAVQLGSFSQGFYHAEARSLHSLCHLDPPKVVLQASASIFPIKTEVLCVPGWCLHSPSFFCS